MLLEVCVDSIESAINASNAGANRIELCSALSEGGLTPSVGLFQGCKRALQDKKTQIFCMIRIRRGNFIYSSQEIDAMMEDISYFKNNGADGIVLGCLREDNEIDIESCQRIINAWHNQRGSKSITFHRAFDETKKEDLRKNIEILKSLGVGRILSSGFENSAEKGIDNLKEMVSYSEEIVIMPGAGINADNVGKIISETGCKEVHGSLKSRVESTGNKLSMGGGIECDSLEVCDPKKVREILKRMYEFLE